MRHTLETRQNEAQRKFAEDIVDEVNRQIGESLLATVSKWHDEGVTAAIDLLRGHKPATMGTVYVMVSPTAAHWTISQMTDPDVNHIHGSEDALMKDASEIALRIVGDIRTFLPLPRDLATQ